MDRKVPRCWKVKEEWGLRRKRYLGRWMRKGGWGGEGGGRWRCKVEEGRRIEGKEERCRGRGSCSVAGGHILISARLRFPGPACSIAWADFWIMTIVDLRFVKICFQKLWNLLTLFKTKTRVSYHFSYSKACSPSHCRSKSKQLVCEPPHSLFCFV